MKKIINSLLFILIFYIGQAQNVGIGTITPGSRLEIKGIGNSQATSSLNVKSNNDSSRLIVKDNGNVGIGTSNPAVRLHVLGSGGDTYFNVEGNGATPDNTAAIQLIDNNNNQVWQITHRGGNDVWNRNKLMFYHYDGTSWKTVISATRDGVGFGTSFPSAMLHVDGGSSTKAGIVISNALTEQSRLSFFSGATQSSLLYRPANSTDLALWGEAYSNHIMYWNTTSGNVGIGTSAPATRLHINGAATYQPAPDINVTADNQPVTVGNTSFLKLASDNSNSTIRTIVLTNGLSAGQILMIECTSNALEIKDGSSNAQVGSTSRSLGQFDVITLIWDGTTWVELGFANN